MTAAKSHKSNALSAKKLKIFFLRFAADARSMLIDLLLEYIGINAAQAKVAEKMERIEIECRNSSRKDPIFCFYLFSDAWIMSWSDIAD